MDPFENVAVEAEPWMRDARCADIGGDLFFPDHGDLWGAKRAISVCDGCDVAAQCLAYAIRTNQIDGVWGGMSAKTRRRLLRRTA